MKSNSQKSASRRTRWVGELCAAMQSMPSSDQLERFLGDLCTPAELEAMADRWKVARLLDTDHSYRDISQDTGVSVTTIGRVARCLQETEGGYRTALAQNQDG